MGGNDLEILAMSPTSVSDRLELCFGHLVNWRDLDIVHKSKEWLARANTTTTPTTLLAYRSGTPAGMIEFLPRNLIKAVGSCPCRAKRTGMKELEALDDGFEDYIFITCLWVPSSHRDQGIGRALLEGFLGSDLFNGHEGALVFTANRDPESPSDVHWPAGPEKFYLDAGFEILKRLGHPAGHILIKRRN